MHRTFDMAGCKRSVDVADTGKEDDIDDFFEGKSASLNHYHASWVPSLILREYVSPST